MTLNFHWLHVPRWMAHAHVSRAMTLVLGVIGVSLLFSVLRVIDTAISGALVEHRAVVVVPAASSARSASDNLVGTDPTGTGAKPVDASLVDVPQATVEAVSL